MYVHRYFRLLLFTILVSNEFLTELKKKYMYKSKNDSI